MSSYRYRITVETLSTPDEAASSPLPSFSFEAGLHDDLFKIVEVMQKSQVVEESAATGLAVGLKLFAETVMRHRKEPNFAVFEAPLRHFIGSLKQTRAR